jgi:hypothetical protein
MYQRKLYIIFILLIILLLNSQLGICQFKIEGQFRNHTKIKIGTSTSLQVTLIKNGLIKQGLSAEIEGVFKIHGSDTGKYTLAVNGNFFAAWDSTFLINNDTIKIIIPLNVLGRTLDTVVVKNKPSIFKIKNDTLIFNLKELKRGNEKNLAGLVNNLPGMQVVEGSILYNGQRVKRLLLDGKDLTGEAYDKVLNNLGVSNIKELQLLSNYKDKFQLSYSIADSMLALNVVFEKKRGLITAARITAGLGLPNNFYEASTDFVGDKKHLTFFLIANSNNHGYSFEGLTQTEAKSTSFSETNIFRARPVGHFLNAVREPYLFDVEKNNYLFNKTNLIDLSTEYRISNTSRTKNIFTWSPDIVRMGKSQFAQVFIGDTVLAQTTSVINNNIKTKNFNWRSETVKMLNKRNQLIFRFNLYNNNKIAAYKELINGIDKIVQPKNTLQLFSTLLEYNLIPSKNSRASVKLFSETEKVTEKFQSNGVAYLGVFLPVDSGVVNNFLQSTSQKQQQIGASIEFSEINEKRVHFITNITIKTSTGSFANGLNVTSLNNYLSKPTFFNDTSKLRRTIVATSFTYTRWLGHWFISASVTPTLFLRLQQNNFVEKNVFAWTSATNISTLLKKYRIGFLLNRDFEIPNTRYFPFGTISNFGNVYKAPTQFFAKEADLLATVFFKSNNFFGATSKIDFSFLYNTMSANILESAEANNFYVVNSISFLNNKTEGLSFVAASFFKNKTSKFVFEPNLTLSTFISPILQNGNLINAKSNAIAYKMALRKLGLKTLNFKLENTLRFTNYSSAGAKLYSAFSSVTNFIGDLAFKKKYFLQTNLMHVFNKISEDDNQQNIAFLNIDFSYRPNAKWGLAAEWRNVFNAKEYIVQNNRPTYFNINRTVLLPMHIFVRLDYNF